MYKINFGFYDARLFTTYAEENTSICLTRPHYILTTIRMGILYYDAN
jgi:hypothetical protein